MAQLTPVTTTGIRASYNADGSRTVTARTTTSVSTPRPAFAEQLREAQCRPTAPTGSAQPPVAAAPAVSLEDLVAQLSELIKQLMARLDAQHGQPSTPPTSGTPAAAPPAPAPAAPVPTPAPAPSASHCSAPRPSRTFDVTSRDGGAPTGGHIRVSGSIATEPVTVGAKLDEGIRRIASFLDQVSAHLTKGGSFTEQQLQDIADEAFGIYREAIRATSSDTDLGDYTSPQRDGVLDLGSTNAATAIVAQIAA